MPLVIWSKCLGRNRVIAAGRGENNILWQSHLPFDMLGGEGRGENSILLQSPLSSDMLALHMLVIKRVGFGY